MLEIHEKNNNFGGYTQDLKRLCHVAMDNVDQHSKNKLWVTKNINVKFVNKK